MLHKYRKEVVPLLQKTLGISNLNAVPKITSVHVNVGIGSYVEAGKDPDDVMKSVALITGQRPVLVKSRKAISNFKLKINSPNGVYTTLRGKNMYTFLDKLVHFALPRIRDFRGIPRKSFDQNGNYSLGIKEHIVFPDIPAEDVSKIHGIQITIKTTAKNDKEARALLEGLGFPFQKDQKESARQ